VNRKKRDPKIARTACETLWLCQSKQIKLRHVPSVLATSNKLSSTAYCACI